MAVVTRVHYMFLWGLLRLHSISNAPHLLFHGDFFSHSSRPFNVAMQIFGVLRLLLPLPSAQSYSLPGYAYNFHLKASISPSSPLSYVEGWDMTIYRTELLPHVGRAVLYNQPARTLYANGQNIACHYYTIR